MFVLSVSIVRKRGVFDSVVGKGEVGGSGGNGGVGVGVGASDGTSGACSLDGLVFDAR